MATATKTATKKKPKPLESWAAVNAALLRIKENEANVARLQGRLDNGMAKLQQRYSPQIDPLQTDLKELAEAVGDFVFVHRKELSEDGGARSVLLEAGRVGLRLSPPKLTIPKKHTWAKVLDVIREMPKSLRDKLIRTKETLDKDALTAAIEDGVIDEDQRRKLGVSLTQVEIAYYELA